MLSDFIERDKRFDPFPPSQMPHANVKRVLLVVTTAHQKWRVESYVDALRQYSNVAVDIIRPTQEVLDEFPFNLDLRNYKTNPTGCDFSELFERYDGFVLSGGRPNVMPELYGEKPEFDKSTHDAARDYLSLGILQQAPAKTPILTICLGMQQLAVAFGAKLKKIDNHGPKDINDDKAYQPAHGIKIRSHTVLHVLQPTAGEVFGRNGAAELTARTTARLKMPGKTVINSVHWRAIDEASIPPESPITVMAHAPDDTIEAIHIKHTNFIGVQNHPEKDVETNPHSRRLFAAFGMMVHGKLDLREPAQFESFPKRFILRQRIAARSAWSRLVAPRG